MPDCETCVYKEQFERNVEPAYEDYRQAHEHAKQLLFSRGGLLKEGRLRILRHYNGIVADLEKVKEVPCGEGFDECQLALRAVNELMKPYNNTPENIRKNI